MNNQELNNFNRAKLFHKDGNWDKAEKIYIDIIKKNPQENEALHYLGVLFFNKGNFLKALSYINRSIQLKDNNAKFYLNKANVLYKLKKYNDAVACYKKSIFLDKSLILAYINLGALYTENKKLKDARDTFKLVLKNDPNDVDALIGLGIVYSSQNLYVEAIRFYTKAITIDPFCIDAINNRGIAYQNLGEYERALEDYIATLKIDMNFAIGYNNKGVILKSYNEIELAIASFKKAIILDENYSEAYKNYFSVSKFYKSDPYIEKVKKLLINTDLSEEEKISLNLTMAKIETNFKNYSKVFEYILKANDIRKNMLNYNIEGHKKHIESLKIFFKKPFISFKNKQENFSSIPIFILGMPRSGTSLIEQIISSHSKIYGAGELGIFNEILNEVNLNSNTDNVSVFKYIRTNYLNKIKKLSKLEFITDKMPGNFKNIGFIINSIPEAKIIHIHRNPMAVCWSNYFNYFPHKAMGYSFDLKTLGEYYYIYKHLMEYWEKVYPKLIYHIKYEDFIENYENEIENLMNFLNLDREDSLLDFYNNKRIVKTASYAQVRKPIYKGSSDEWKNYKKWLKPIMQVLDNHKIHY